MAKTSFSNQKLAGVSIIIGVLSWLMYAPPLPQLPIPHRTVSVVLGLVGFAFGAMSVKTKAGFVGIFLNLLAVINALFFLVLSILYLHN